MREPGAGTLGQKSGGGRRTGTERINPEILQCPMSPPQPPRAETAAARAALAWCHTARFLVTASQLVQLPAGGPPEFAFVGRSNAGKSTAINTLAQHRRLAFASRTPGRTQHVNLFEVGPKDSPDALWADLPGYGYAAVERGARLRWQEVMAEYLATRRPLAGVVLMIDSRLGFTPLDVQLLDFVAPRVRSGEVRLLALLTKSDKLNRSQAQAALVTAQEVLGGYADESADVSVTLFSALSRQGLEDVAETLLGWARATAPAVAAQAPSEGLPAEPATAGTSVDPATAGVPSGLAGMGMP